MVGIFAPIFEIYLTLNWHSFAHEDLAGNPIKVHLEAGIRIKKQTFWKPSFEKMRRLLWESDWAAGVYAYRCGLERMRLGTRFDRLCEDHGREPHAAGQSR